MAFYSAEGTLTTSGTKVPLLAVTTLADWVGVYPKSTNSGILYFGGTTVSATSLIGSPMGVGDAFFAPAIPRGPLEPPPYDLSQMYIDGDTSGDKFTVIYGRKL